MSHTIIHTRQRSPMWVYEKNYACLVQLLPFLFEQDGLMRVCARHLNARLAVSILEQCRYTQIVEIKQIFTEVSQHLRGLTMKVRIYHDAQLAEVISYQGHSRILSKYLSAIRLCRAIYSRSRVLFASVSTWANAITLMARAGALATNCSKIMVE